eukprot:c20750_g1_i5.p2 GENE.c20750_g1_i5~~c20750_g1_i5.p2  ORF type:complete len:101 (+),score=21.81 c20750_g1_i5:457-759(+)
MVVCVDTATTDRTVSVLEKFVRPDSPSCEGQGQTHYETTPIGMQITVLSASGGRGCVVSEAVKKCGSLRFSSDESDIICVLHADCVPPHFFDDKIRTANC